MMLSNFCYIGTIWASDCELVYCELADCELADCDLADCELAEWYLLYSIGR